MSHTYQRSHFLTLLFTALPVATLLSQPRALYADSSTAPSPTASTCPAPASDSAPASDQLRDMDTDRPNLTNTPTTIDAGHVQIETGFLDYSFNRTRTPDGKIVRTDAIDAGQFNVRLGVLDNLELNVVINSFDYLRSHDPDAGVARTSGFGDTTLGGKFNFWGNEINDKTWATALAIQPQFSFPTARDSLGEGRLQMSVALPFYMNLPYAFHFYVQPTIGMQRNVANDGYVTSFGNAVSVDRVVIGKLDTYIEYASDFTTEQHAKTEQTLDLGLTYPLTDNIQLDAGVNLGLNHASNKFDVVTGISVRF
jgi:hypothetical protein